jgi:integrase/recombinase XerD
MRGELTTVNIPWRIKALSAKAPELFLTDAKAAGRFFDFFTVNIRNKNTRRAYYKAVCRFAEWCKGRRVGDLARVKPFHVAAYVESLGAELAKPSVKLHLAALRMLLDARTCAADGQSFLSAHDQAL